MKLSTFLDKLTDYNGPDSKGDYVGICPAHSDGAPSLLVGQGADGRLLVHCRAGCSKEAVLAAAGMSMADLFTKDGKVDAAAPTSKAVADKSGPGPAEYAALRGYSVQCAEKLQDDPEALEYVRSRFGLSAADAASLTLGLDPGGAWYSGPLVFGPTYLQVPRLVIPFYDFEGRVAGLQGRALRDHKVRWSGPTNPDGIALSKFAVMDRGTGLESIIITEGPGDALTAVSAGFDALAIGGVAVAKNVTLQATLVAGLQGRRIVLAGDDDAAGRSYNDTLAAVFTEAGLDVYRLPWRTAPEGAKDVTAWQEADPGGFLAAFQTAVDHAEHPDKDDDDDTPDEGRWTEVAMARRLRDRMADGGPGVIYSEGLGFHLWSGTNWLHDRSGHLIRQEAQAMVEELIDHYMTGLLAAGKDEKLAAKWKKELKQATRFESSTLLSGVLKELEAMVFEQTDKLDRDHHLLNVQNGTINLRSGKLQPHKRSDLITRCLKVNYDPDATCDRWERFLGEIFPGDAGLVDYVRRLVGYGVTGETSEQCFAVLWGTGANGKSVFTDTLTEVFQDISTTTPFSTFEQRPNGGIPNDVAALKGARLVFASEGEQGKLMAESVIKRVTGSDVISARFMRQEFFEFRPTFLIMLATNHKPRFKGQDEGLWRRVKLIPFERYFAPHERDHHLTRDLRAEGEGILAWAVRGAVDWYKADGLAEPDSLVDATEAYRDAADGMMGFVDLYVEACAGERVRALDVYERYKQHVTEEGMRDGEVWGNRTFYEAMGERGYERKKMRIGGKPEWALLGMRLLTADEASRGLDDGTPGKNPLGNPVGGEQK